MKTQGMNIRNLYPVWLNGHITYIVVSNKRAKQIVQAFDFVLPKIGWEVKLPNNWFGFDYLVHDANGYHIHIKWSI